MRIETPTSVLRDWTEDDIPALVQNADNPRIASGLRDGFPSPYTEEDARRFITTATTTPGALLLAIDVAGEAIGGIGVHPLADVYRKTAEIGYWVAQPYWGRGIATDAVRALVPVAFRTSDIVRLQAGVFSGNPASMRVLEKCGFFREAVHRNAVFKNGTLMDEVLYVRFR